MTKRQRELIAEGFVGIAEAAAWLAISRSRLYELVAAGVLSHSRISGKIVVPRAALREYALATFRPGSVA